MRDDRCEKLERWHIRSAGRASFSFQQVSLSVVAHLAHVTHAVKLKLPLRSAPKLTRLAVDTVWESKHSFDSCSFLLVQEEVIKYDIQLYHLNTMARKINGNDR